MPNQLDETIDKRIAFLERHNEVAINKHGVEPSSPGDTQVGPNDASEVKGCFMLTVELSATQTEADEFIQMMRSKFSDNPLVRRFQLEETQAETMDLTYGDVLNEIKDRLSKEKLVELKNLGSDTGRIANALIKLGVVEFVDGPIPENKLTKSVKNRLEGSEISNFLAGIYELLRDDFMGTKQLDTKCMCYICKRKQHKNAFPRKTEFEKMEDTVERFSNTPCIKCTRHYYATR